ncbi:MULTISPECIES: APC family permease [Actinopolyspora]|uniref:Amino acid/polyamine/organocation transporter, APC superfamily n=1 Tax=Actinopolyspora saharensis TaxID=995062 RepID=A0A1H0ZSS8_9ACTN|nr:MULTISPECIES: APC family permease [Actinopolyspora]NHD15603.1 APC family permease [Actinopolyspora sp. BKK2]NHE75184.1 APC family permease [Actinopolyspora sp. BKK1]SDQ30412.1 amino acid/polyamine/organocation transporter, APC superfamily [Actinopolyspora saharensis]
MSSTPPANSPALARRLGTFDAVVLGLGSMLGAGVFAAFGPAAAAAGSGLLIALAVAAAVAYCNATASARLAARYPESGGTYVYAGRRLGPVWGFLAGWGFVVGKTASCAAMALTMGAYAWPQQPVPVAVAAVVVLTGVNCLGVEKTARVTRVLVVLTLLALAGAVAACLGGGQADPARLTGWFPHGFTGITQAAALLFFAFAGYARIATLGEEVRDPARTIPRAVPLALLLVVLVYAAVGAAALLAVGPGELATSTAPLATAARAGGLAGLAVVVRIGGAVAAAGVLLSLMAGIGRTGLAMARHGELPRWLAAVHPRRRVPHRAELLLGAVVLVLVLLVDLRGAIGFSSFAVLLYYALTNAAAFTLPGPRRGLLRPLTVLGGAGCVLLAATLPAQAVLGGGGLLLAGLVLRAVHVRWRGGRAGARS